MTNLAITSYFHAQSKKNNLLEFIWKHFVILHLLKNLYNFELWIIMCQRVLLVHASTYQIYRYNLTMVLIFTWC